MCQNVLLNIEEPIQDISLCDDGPLSLKMEPSIQLCDQCIPAGEHHSSKRGICEWRRSIISRLIVTYFFLLIMLSFFTGGVLYSMHAYATGGSLFGINDKFELALMSACSFFFIVEIILGSLWLYLRTLRFMRFMDKNLH